MGSSPATRTALITGGTSGVGLSIARGLVQRGYQVHIVGTREAKGRAIEAELNTAAPLCRFIRQDLSDLSGVQALAESLRARVPRLDVLVNGAGVLLPRREVTADGLERTFAIGYLSAFLLCRELEPILSAAGHARILNVSGSASRVLEPRLDFDDLNSERRYRGIRAALDTVHAKTALAQVLAERLSGKGIDVNAFHPGAVKSDLGRNMSPLVRGAFKVARRFMSSASESGIYACTSDAVRGMTGQYFDRNQLPRPLDFDEAYTGRLWSLTEEMVGRRG